MYLYITSQQIVQMFPQTFFSGLFKFVLDKGKNIFENLSSVVLDKAIGYRNI